MNFPMEYPIFQFFYWLVNTAGIGGVIALIAGGGSILTYFLIIKWITQVDLDEVDKFSYPTPTLHEHDQHSAHEGEKNRQRRRRIQF